MPDLNAFNSRIIDLTSGMKRAAKAVDQDLYIPDQNKATIKDQRRQEVRTAVRDLHRQAQEVATQRRAQLDQKMADSYLPAGDAAAGIAADEQTWRRVKGLLDQGVAAPEIVKDARARGDKRTLKVLQDEYRPYQWGRTGNAADGDALDGALQEARYVTGPADYRAAVEERAQVDKTLYAIDSNASSVEADLDPFNTAETLSNVLITADHGVVSTEAPEDE